MIVESRGFVLKLDVVSSNVSLKILMSLLQMNISVSKTFVLGPEKWSPFWN